MRFSLRVILVWLSALLLLPAGAGASEIGESDAAGADRAATAEAASGRPAATWDVLVLFYTRTEFVYTDQAGRERRFVSTVDKRQRHSADKVLKEFVKKDVRALTSGAMKARLTLRHPDHPLTGLEPHGVGFWPSPLSTLTDRDPRFDAVIVVWNPLGSDALTGEPLDVTSFAGLTADMGTGQTYATVILQAVTGWGNHNALKHEFGHSILFYFEAIGATPMPAVNNHTDPFTYVHCGSGTFYVFEDETEDVEIPNSIYNNNSGFTHDYYSGTTALASDPNRCLGITPQAWAAPTPSER